jgi:tetratricopeptide (TPR) repeat protein
VSRNRDGLKTFLLKSIPVGEFRITFLKRRFFCDTAFALSLIASIAPLQVRAQCTPLNTPPKPPSPASQSSSSTSALGAPEFFDEPQFTVAGVTDASTPGGHGTSMSVRTKEALARDTASLSGKDLSAETENSLREALQRNPNDAALHHSLADVEEKLGNPLEAVREYQRAAELDPSEPHHFDWGAELLVHRAFEPAGTVFAQGNRLFPRSVRMLIGLGVSWYDRGAYDHAADRLCEASDLNPADPTPYIFMGKIQALEDSEPEGMSERIERFANLQPENALANYYYAVSLWKRRKNAQDEAASQQVESLLIKSVRIDPKFAPAYLQLGIVYAERKDWQRAISLYQQSIQADPQLEEPHYRLAETYRINGQSAKAAQELQIHTQVKKSASEEAERQRRDIQEFVYTLRGLPSAPQAKP